METRIFGNSGQSLSRIGLGCFSMSGAYGAADDTESIATIRRAIDLGVTLLDTSASYGQGHNHQLIGKALKGGLRDKVFIHSKTGTVRAPDGSSIAEGSGSAARLRAICELSLKNLGIETLDAFCMSRVDPTVPIEDSVGTMARMVEEGKTRFIGLSEAAPETVRRANAVHRLVSLQFEYSLWTRDVEGGHLTTCGDLGLALMAYAPLGYGFLTGAVGGRDALEKGDTRHKFPRFGDDNAAANRAKVAVIQEIASAHGATAAQIAIAWVLARGEGVFPIPGCKSRAHLEDNIAAIELELSPEDLKTLDAAFPPGAAAGDRYEPGGMKRVNL
jgi:aryl-alcohol dehydrogenase-like predicted oxidoreductase